jgi:hypothetical protein
MNAPCVSLLPSAPPAPVFTLGSALRWLGHDCPDCLGCEPIAGLNASVWFIRRGPAFRPSPLETLVLLDLPEIRESLERIDWIIHEVNCCTRGEAIHVRQRYNSENRDGVIALAWRSRWRADTGPTPREGVGQSASIPLC